MILVQFAFAATAIAAALTVMAWAADRTGPTCDVAGCDDPPTAVVTRMTDGNRLLVCHRCAEELTARHVAWRSR